MDGVVLVLGDDLKVRAVGWSNWDRFWLRNGGGDERPDLSGREITDFFTAGEVRDAFRKVFTDVVAGRRRNAIVDYRCDAPSTIRQMRLSVTPIEQPEGIAGLLYQSILLAAEHRPAVPLGEAHDDAAAAVKVCTICARIAWPPDPEPASQVWIEPQDYYRSGGPDAARIDHRFCRPCYSRLVEEFD